MSFCNFIKTPIYFPLQHGCYTCLHKYHSVEAWKKFAAEHPEALPYAACSAGTATGDFERLDEILNAIPEIKERQLGNTAQIQWRYLSRMPVALSYLSVTSPTLKSNQCFPICLCSVHLP